MNILVTAGNTLVPIDSVRCITNIFTGRTGATIALCAHERGHHVQLLTSHPEVIAEPPGERWVTDAYRTFDDLAGLMQRCIQDGPLDALIHCAAVSDYLSAGAYTPAAGTKFDPATGTWHAAEGEAPALIDRTSGHAGRGLKLKSDEPEMWIRFTRAPKLVDRIRADWHFRGVLVKFKLEVGVSDDALLEIAERSRQHSDANLMVANTLETASASAWIGPLAGGYQRVERADLARRLLEEVERLARA
jgi:phosphopantothenoylcysteine synthetase/decarboxylase